MEEIFEKIRMVPYDYYQEDQIMKHGTVDHRHRFFGHHLHIQIMYPFGKENKKTLSNENDCSIDE